MKRHLLMAVLAGVGFGARCGFAGAPDVVIDGPANLPAQGAQAVEGGGEQQEDQGGGALDPNSPAVQQVEQALQAVNEEQANTRDAAEERLASMGTAAVPALKDAAGRYAGFKRAAAEGALFRITNGIKPRDAIASWAKKNADGQRAKGERVTDPALGELFPHHLFYVLIFGEKAKLPAGVKTRMVVGMAADGKMQSLTEDAGLARFLMTEGGVLKSAGERARIGEAAVLLACGREAGGYPVVDEIMTSEAGNVVTSEGVNKKAKVTVVITMGANGRVGSVGVKRAVVEEKKALEKKEEAATEKKGEGNGDATEPATEK